MTSSFSGSSASTLRLARHGLGLALLAALSPCASAQAADTDADGDTAKTLETVKATGERQKGYVAQPSASGTGLTLTPLETPQSISTLSRQQLDDFGLNNADAALTLATGVNVEVVETDRTYYTARGFDITNFQVDGLGLPFTNGGAEGDIDTAIYDHIEVLRGANGLTSSTGNPSATINFVRKRPTEDFQGQLGVSGGSWSNYRFDADVSGKLNQAGSVRGRAVAAYQDGNSYLDRYSKKKKVVYGVVEADLSDSTLLTLGASYQKSEPHGGMWGALPLYYTDGTATNYARSTSTSADWTYWNTTDKRVFLELEQQLGADWVLKSSLNYRKFNSDGELFYVYGTPVKGSSTGLYSYPSAYSSSEDQKYGTVQVNGSFPFAGRSHDAVVGVRWERDKVNQLSWYSNDIGTDIGSLQDWTGAYSKPSFDAYSSSADFDIDRKTAYASVRWSLTDRLKLITGLNHTWIKSSGQNYGVAHDYQASKSSPFFGAIYNFDPNYALYGSYAEIFNPQTEVDITNHVLAPVTGSNAEMGIKGQWLHGKVNASMALFRAKQNNLADDATYSTSISGYYYTPVDATSTGFELAVEGQVGQHLQLSGGYTQLSLKDADGENALTYTPRRTLKLAGTYQIPEWEQLRIGANLRWQDAISRDQGVTSTSGTEIITRQGSYALLGLMTSYDFTPKITATLNLNNVTDRKYINSLYWDQGYYGAGRNWWLSVNYRF